jgi:hypothetical protein
MAFDGHNTFPSLINEEEKKEKEKKKKNNRNSHNLSCTSHQALLYRCPSYVNYKQ